MLEVVIVQRGFVGIGMPYGKIADLGCERRAGERMVERTGLAVIHEGIRPVGRQVHVARGRENLQRVFFPVRVQVADDEDVRIPACRRIALKPLDQRDSRARPGQVTVTLAVAGVRVAGLVAS